MLYYTGNVIRIVCLLFVHISQICKFLQIHRWFLPPPPSFPFFIFSRRHSLAQAASASCCRSPSGMRPASASFRLASAAVAESTFELRNRAYRPRSRHCPANPPNCFRCRQTTGVALWPDRPERDQIAVRLRRLHRHG